MSAAEIVLAAALAIAFGVVVWRLITKRGRGGCHCGGECPYRDKCK